MDTDLVADTSTIIAVIANEPKKPLLIAKTQGYDLVAPRSLVWEIGNAFSAMIKRGRITLEQATTAIEIYEQIPIKLVDVDLKQALEHHRHLRTTNVIESPFATVRLRTDAAKRFRSARSGTPPVFKILQSCEARWRIISHPEKLKEVKLPEKET